MIVIMYHRSKKFGTPCESTPDLFTWIPGQSWREEKNKQTRKKTRKQASKPESLYNLGEKNEDFKLSEPLANAHAGALSKWKAHKGMNCLLRAGDSLVLENTQNPLELFSYFFQKLTYSFSDFIHLSGRNTSGLLINWREDSSSFVCYIILSSVIMFCCIAILHKCM